MQARVRRASVDGGGVGRAAFTLMELLFSMAIIFLLMGLLLVGFRAVSRGAMNAADRQAVNALAIGVEQFRQEFGMPPPLVKDSIHDAAGGPLADEDGDGDEEPLVYDPADSQDLEKLRGVGMSADTPGNPDIRFSVYSLPYYLVGALDEEIDGVDGPGFLEPRKNGSFKRRLPNAPHTGLREFKPFFDPGANAKSLYVEDAENGKVVLRDRRGVPYRYYRWARGDNQGKIEETADLNVPTIVGDAGEDKRFGSAEYAIVAAGSNRVFGDFGTEDPIEVRMELGMSSGSQDAKVLRSARSDNIVEVGR